MEGKREGQGRKRQGEGRRRGDGWREEKGKGAYRDEGPPNQNPKYATAYGGGACRCQKRRLITVNILPATVAMEALLVRMMTSNF